MTEAVRHSTHRSGRARQALAHLPEVDPALASLAIWCDIQDGEDPHSYTSGDVIHIGLGFESLPLQEQIGVLGHHVLHVACRHEVALSAHRERLGDAFDADLFNLCADALVNTCLSRAGHALPRPAVFAAELATDVITGDSSVASDLSILQAPQRLYAQIEQSCTDTQRRAYDYARAKRFAPDIRVNAPNPTADRHADWWRRQVLRAGAAGRGSGRGIGAVLSRLGDPTGTGTPWEHRLRGSLAKAMDPSPRRSFRRPRSGWIARDADAARFDTPRPVFEPSVHRQSLRQRIVVGLDSSSSVSDRILRRFSGEVVGIAHRTGAETYVLCFDETVYAAHKLDAHNARATLSGLHVRREGGTSFTDFFDRAQNLDPSVIVVLSDAAGQMGQAPAAQVIWVCPTLPSGSLPFGEVIHLDV